MDIQEFCELVCDPEQMYKYPVFLGGFVVPNKTAFRQWHMEVKCTKAYTHEEWMSNAFLRTQRWPQTVEQLYEIFIKEYYHE